MRHIKTILNAILSKSVFEYILIDRNLCVVESSMGLLRYLKNTPFPGEDIRDHFPEMIGYEAQIATAFEKEGATFELETVEKSGFYFNIYIDHYDHKHVLLLFHNITQLTRTKQKMLQYGNEKSLLSGMLQKIIDAQDSLLFVVSGNEEIIFSNGAFRAYFELSTKEALASFRLYHYCNKQEQINDYDTLFALIDTTCNQIHINHDTFFVSAKKIDRAYTLYTLTKITDIYQTKQQLEFALKNDSLTGVWRKEPFDLKLSEWIKQGKAFALVVVDIDHFKSINDTYGHIVGDEVLKEFARLLLGQLKENEMIARWGGEEFLLALEGDDVKMLLKRLESIRQEIYQHPFSHINHLSASLGFSIYRGKEDDLDALLWRADKALYDAKSDGKNRVSYR